MAIFDSNVHLEIPETCEERSNYLIGIENFLRHGGAISAMAVNLPGMNKLISQQSYYDALRNFPFFRPVWALSSLDATVVQREAEVAIENGFRMLKVHPRLLKVPLTDQKIKRALTLLSRMGLAVMLCTYPYGRSNSSQLHVPSALQDVVPLELPIIFMHGGSSQILDVAEWARTRGDHQLVDLSLTISQLFQSSIRFDMVSLFSRFERRIVVGSEYPFENFESYMENLRWVSDHVDKDKADFALHKNLAEFVGRFM